jgi:hypothetical protein
MACSSVSPRELKRAVATASGTRARCRCALVLLRRRAAVVARSGVAAMPRRVRGRIGASVSSRASARRMRRGRAANRGATRVWAVARGIRSAAIKCVSAVGRWPARSAARRPERVTRSAACGAIGVRATISALARRTTRAAVGCRASNAATRAASGVARVLVRFVPARKSAAASDAEGRRASVTRARAGGASGRVVLIRVLAKRAKWVRVAPMECARAAWIASGLSARGNRATNRSSVRATAVASSSARVIRILARFRRGRRASIKARAMRARWGRASEGERTCARVRVSGRPSVTIRSVMCRLRAIVTGVARSEAHVTEIRASRRGLRARTRGSVLRIKAMCVVEPGGRLVRLRAVGATVTAARGRSFAETSARTCRRT